MVGVVDTDNSKESDVVFGVAAFSDLSIGMVDSSYVIDPNVSNCHSF